MTTNTKVPSLYYMNLDAEIDPNLEARDLISTSNLTNCKDFSYDCDFSILFTVKHCTLCCVRAFAALLLVLCSLFCVGIVLCMRFCVIFCTRCTVFESLIMPRRQRPEQVIQGYRDASSPTGPNPSASPTAFCSRCHKHLSSALFCRVTRS